MTEATPVAQGSPEELLLRVNDFISLANRIERRFDSGHAQTAFLHAFVRYSAHHYRSTVKVDSLEERKAFVNYFAGAVVHLLMQDLDTLVGKISATDAQAAQTPSPDAPAAE